MGSLKNCTICGKLYVEIGHNMCANCFEQEQIDEQTVTAYVREHKKCDLHEIVDATKVKESTVLRMIKKGVFITEGLSITYYCQKCGKPITTGKLCEQCKQSLLEQLKKQTNANDLKKQNLKQNHVLYNASLND